MKRLYMAHACLTKTGAGLVTLFFGANDTVKLIFSRKRAHKMVSQVSYLRII